MVSREALKNLKYAQNSQVDYILSLPFGDSKGGGVKIKNCMEGLFNSTSSDLVELEWMTILKRFISSTLFSIG